MKPLTRQTLTTVLDRFSFITEGDMAALLSDDRTRSRLTLIRCDSNRHVVPLYDVLEVLHREGDSVRDVSFTVDSSAALRKELANLR